MKGSSATRCACAMVMEEGVCNPGGGLWFLDDGIADGEGIESAEPPERFSIGFGRGVDELAVCD